MISSVELFRSAVRKTSLPEIEPIRLVFTMGEPRSIWTAKHSFVFMVETGYSGSQFLGRHVEFFYFADSYVSVYWKQL